MSKLSINVVVEDSLATMVLEGPINTRTSEELGQAIASLDSSVSSVDLDFSAVSFLSSAGIRELLIGAKQCEDRGGELRVLNPTESTAEPFGLSNLGLVLTIVTTEDE